MHLFEVRKNGKTYMLTDCEESIPDANTLKDIRAAGYKIYIYGKQWTGIKMERKNEK